jgi:hypothetical protein
VLGLGGERLEGAPDLLLHLRARRALDAAEDTGHVAEVRRLRRVAHVCEPRFDRCAVEVGHQLEGLVVQAHESIPPG